MTKQQAMEILEIGTNNNLSLKRYFYIFKRRMENEQEQQANK